MAIRTIVRGPSGGGVPNTGYVSRPNANFCYVDGSTDVLVFSTGTSGTSTKTVVDTTSTQTLTNKTLTSPTVTGGQNTVTVTGGEGAGPNALTVAQSGSTLLFDRAAGKEYTLPAATAGNVGVWYHFKTTVTVTSNDYEIATNTPASEFIGGSVLIGKSATAPLPFQDNGTSNAAIVMNGTTTGGTIGDDVYIELVAANLWLVTAILFGSGTLATPFAAS